MATMSAMAEEPQPQPQSIQERIKSLNQAHVVQAPNGGPPTPSTNGLPSKPPPPTKRPPVRPRPKTPIRSESGSDGHIPLRERETLPPPTIIRTGQKTPTPTPSDSSSSTSSKPPPLPTRRQLSPPLPTRRPSDQMSRKASFESTSSASTARTTSGASTATNESNTSRVMRAPAWGEAELPKLPPRREKTEKQPVKPLTPSRPSRPSIPTNSPPRQSKSPAPRLPKSPPSRGREEEVSEPPAPKLPPRRPTNGVSNGVSNGASDAGAAPAASSTVIGEYVKPPQRKLPPPVPSTSSLNKIKQSSFADLNKARDTPPLPVRSAHNDEPSSLNKIKQSSFGELNNKARNIPSLPVNGTQNDESQNDQSKSAPPPIPLSSRPDLSKIQATKPKPAEVAAAALRCQSTVCMKCRDFSAPDNHAAQFPRQSVPSNDLAWLGKQLTSPFSSHTDKARAVFTWLHHNIAYDVDAFFGNRVKGSTPESTFSSGLAVCEGYAALFTTLATHGGLEAVKISGHGKGFGHTPLGPNDPIPPFKSSHAWNAVRIDGGQWKLIDPCWGAGCVQGKGMPYQKRFEPSQFIMPNDEFGRRHFPSDDRYFFRNDGRPSISWEEYIVDDFSKINGMDRLTVFTGAKENHGIGERSIQPPAKQISVNTAGPIRFQFGLVCEHWTLQEHSNIPAPQVFFLLAHGRDGSQKNYHTFDYVRGTGPNGGGDMWYVDIPDARELGTPGQKLTLYSVTSFGGRKDTRGLSIREVKEKAGKIAMAYGGVAAWELV